MKSCMFTFLLIFYAILFLPISHQVTKAPLCCKNSAFIVNSILCDDGKDPLVSCKNNRWLITNSTLPYRIAQDDQREYLDAYDFIIHPPYFCIESRDTNNSAAIMCTVNQIWKNELTRQKRSADNEKILTYIYKAAVSVLNIISIIFLSVTSLIYCIIPQAQDIEGQCIFHFTMALNVRHLFDAFLIWSGNGFESFFGDFCVTSLSAWMFVFLSVFTWSCVLSYHIWSRSRSNVRRDESNLMFRYRIIAYGIPALLVLSTIILGNLHDASYEQDLFCLYFFLEIFIQFVLYPFIFIEVLNGFFYIDLQRRVWNVPSANLQPSRSLRRKILDKLKINFKLFIIMGIPWAVIIFCMWMRLRNDLSFLSIIIRIMGLIVISEGIFIFYIMVINRKRVYQGLISKLRISRCRSPDAEESAESECEDKNENGNELIDVRS